MARASCFLADFFCTVVPHEQLAFDCTSMNNFLSFLSFWIVVFTHGAACASGEFRLRAIEPSLFPYFSPEISGAAELRVVDGCWYATSADDAMEFSHGAQRDSSVLCSKGYDFSEKRDVRSLVTSVLSHLATTNPQALIISGYHNPEVFAEYVVNIVAGLSSIPGSDLQHVMLDGSVINPEVFEQCVRAIMASPKCKSLLTLTVRLGSLLRLSCDRRESVSSESCSSEDSLATVRHVVPGDFDADKPLLGGVRRSASVKRTLRHAVQKNMRNNFFCATGGASYLTLRFSEREEFGRKIAGMALRLVAPGRLAGHAIFEERIPQKLFSALVTICAGGACASGGDVACYLSKSTPKSFTPLLECMLGSLDISVSLEGSLAPFLWGKVAALGLTLSGKFLGLLECVIPDGLQADLALWLPCCAVEL